MRPDNQEHWEAGQTEIDRKRYEAMAKMRPEEQDRFKIIEQAVSLLERAKIPFFLWATPENEVKGLWQYHRSTYLDQFTKEGEEDRRKLMSLGIQSTAHFFAKTWHFNIIATDEAGNVVMTQRFE